MKYSRFNYLLPESRFGNLLFNTRTYALIKLDNDTFNRFIAKNMTALEQDELVKMGFLVGDNVDEISELEAAWLKKHRDSSSISVTVMVTDDCNFRCPYCYQEHIPKYMTISMAEALCKYFAEKKKDEIEYINVHWFGGEPLLNTAPIFFVEDFLKTNGIKGTSSITTNGYLISDEMLEKIHLNTRIRSLQITLDGTPAQHNMTRKHLSGRPTYDIIRSNIQRAVAKGFFVTIRLNLTRKNQDISEFVNEINSMNLKRNRYRVHITNAHQFDNSASLNDFYFRSAEEYSKAFDTVQNVFVTNGYKFPRNYPRSYGCEFDKANTFLVSSDLNLYFCTSCELTESFHQGYIRKDGALCLNENYLKREAYSPFNDFECRNCLMLPMCLGGCTYCRIKNKKFCIPEKYFINRFVEKLYCESRSIAEIST